ncbi:IS110 family transposase [Streptomyces sp. NBC_00299]|uniref:IS110 family transposase n=1 Tax=Streptomyces sp. NBC_00299 TaxID=2975705 RepID=UPI002E28F23B|nr:transposase [Streptomyces sp. NBC_00299]
MATIWAGIDAGKTHHHCVAIDESGHRLLSRRVTNDEPEILELLTDVVALGDEVTWGIDLADGGAALAITILLNHDQPVLYLSGRAIHRASEGYRGEGKTDAKDAAVIADQARIRRDLHPLRTGDETVTDLKILTNRRTDLVADRTRTVNRLRAHLTSIFPGLERALDLTNTGPLTLLTGYQTPAALRRLGVRRLKAWLRNRSARNADQLAGVAPAPRDSGKVSGNLRRPQRYNRRLQRVFYTSALFSIRGSEESRRFYDRKRAEGKRHTQAVMALARRRVNVIWALLRDGRRYEPVSPTALAA